MSTDYSDDFAFDPTELTFDAPNICPSLVSLSIGDLELLRFGVIGINHAGMTTRYTLREADEAGRPTKHVLGLSVHEALKPILNGAQIVRYLEDWVGEGRLRDEVIRCDLIHPVGAQLRMRLIFDPAVRTRFILIER